MSSSGANTIAGEGQSRRLFFALWPDGVLRQHLKRHSKSLLHHGGGRPVTLENTHITLAFLGNVETNRQVCVEHVADGIQCPPFKFTIDTADYWPRPHILWVGPTTMPDALVNLATALRDGAIECGLQLDMMPYRAHVTLVRKVARAPSEMKVRPFDWEANAFVLVSSTTSSEGVKYEVVREWPLSGTAHC